MKGVVIDIYLFEFILGVYMHIHIYFMYLLYLLLIYLFIYVCIFIYICVGLTRTHLLVTTSVRLFHLFSQSITLRRRAAPVSIYVF